MSLLFHATLARTVGCQCNLICCWKSLLISDVAVTPATAASLPGRLATYACTLSSLMVHRNVSEVGRRMISSGTVPNEPSSFHRMMLTGKYAGSQTLTATLRRRGSWTSAGVMSKENTELVAVAAASIGESALMLGITMTAILMPIIRTAKNRNQLLRLRYPALACAQRSNNGT